MQISFVDCCVYFWAQASSIHVNPLYLMLPVTVAASFAFMLPVATPPNAIVFAYGQMKILDMVSFCRSQNVQVSDIISGCYLMLRLK